MENTLTPAKLAGEIFDIISLQEALWNQSSWFDHAEVYITEERTLSVQEWLDELANPTCGTTACVAGWAAIKTAPKGSRITASGIRLPNGDKREASLMGREALGLDYRDANWLFDSERSRDEVMLALAAIRDGQPFRISDFADYPEVDDDDPCDCPDCMDDDDY